MFCCGTHTLLSCKVAALLGLALSAGIRVQILGVSRVSETSAQIISSQVKAVI